MGIRVAIDAGRGEVVRLVLGNGLVLALYGLILGLIVAAVVARLMTSLLHDVTPGDPTTFIAVAVVLTMVALVASFVPAWRATRVDS